MGSNGQQGLHTVAIKIGGREYRLRTDEDASRMESVAAHVDRMMREAQRTAPDSQDAAILTALQLARDLLEMRDHLSVVQRDRLQSLIDLVDSA